MSSILHTSKPWGRITSAARRTKGSVAVAYLGAGAAKLLPLRAGSTLVVDASEAAVRSGQTDPRELESLHNAGVDVFSVGNLHAKVFVFGNVAIVGSTNVSNRSATQLVEAALETSVPGVVKTARNFVKAIATEPLGPEHIERLIKIYKPPKFLSRGPKQKKRRRVIPMHAPIRIVKLDRIRYSGAEKTAKNEGEQIARRELKARFWLDDYCSGAGHPKDGELVLQVVTERRGVVMVSPPGRVLHRQRVRGSKGCIVFLEMPAWRRRSLARARRLLSPGVAKRLRRGGYVSRQKAAELLSLWRK